MRHPTLKRSLTGARIVTIIVMMFVLLPASQLPNPPQASAAYSCSGAHCYGTNRWVGDANGASTHLDIRQISCATCATGHFINIAQWYAPSTSAWIEGGYGTFNYPTDRYPGNYNHRVSYYWADYRPTWGYYEHELGIITVGDYGPNKYLTVEIEMTTTRNQFRVYMRSPNWFPPTYYSTDNTMGKGRIIDVGAELYGTSGASAPDLYIYDNRWIDSFGNKRPQTVDGYYGSNPGPINRGWAFPPSMWPGGNFHVQCGC